MQIIETSVLGVRSAAWSFVNVETQDKILLFPMVHIAEPQFYEEVLERLLVCDVILFEGVRSPITRRVTQSYMQMVKSKKLNLVSQSTMDTSAIKDRMVLADIKGEEFEAEWRSLPFWERYIVPQLAFFFGIYMRFFATRKMLAQHLSLELVEDREEFMDDRFQSFHELIIDQRDAHLLGVIDEQIESRAGKGECIGIIYGAGHMRSVIHHLSKTHNYRVETGEWMDVFKL